MLHSTAPRAENRSQEITDISNGIKVLAKDDEDSGVPVVEDDALPVNLLIAEQRNGPIGDVNLTFLKSYTRFESAAKVSDEDVPH